MKDPYLKPVIFGGLFIAILSIIFAPAIFIWSIVGGYITVRLSHKITKEVISYFDGLVLGMFTGIIGGACLDIFTIISFKDPENQRSLIRILEKNWRNDLPIPNFQELLPSIFIVTCIFIIIVATAFAVLGAYIGTIISKKSKPINN